MSKPVLNVHILHSPKLLALRESMCKALLQKLGERFDVKSAFVTQHEPDDINVAEMKGLFDLTAPADAPDPVYKTLVQSLHIRQVSNVLKHSQVLKDIAAATDDGAYHLVVEDDVLYNPDIAEQVERTISLSKSESAEVVMLGLPTLSDANRDTKQAKLDDVSSTFRVLPCCESYLITPKTAQAMVAVFNPCRFPGHVQLSYVFARANIKAKAIVPNLFVDGSKVGVYISSLNPNNKLFLNDDYNKILAIVRRATIADVDIKEAAAIFDVSRFNGHPDMAYLMAVLEAKAGHYEKAIDMMGKIFEVYKQNSALMGSESEFLRTYISLHKHVADSDVPVLEVQRDTKDVVAAPSTNEVTIGADQACAQQ